MKLAVAHPLRDWWLRLKSLLIHSRGQIASPVARPPTPPKPHRMTAFFELP